MIEDVDLLPVTDVRFALPTLKDTLGLGAVASMHSLLVVIFPMPELEEEEKRSSVPTRDVHILQRFSLTQTAFSVVRWNPYLDHTLLAAGDFGGNLMVVDLAQLGPLTSNNEDSYEAVRRLVVRAHDAAVVDVAWALCTASEAEGQALHLGSISHDGLFRVWTTEGTGTVPLYEYNGARKWGYRVQWDERMSSFLFNMEGRYFSQKIVRVGPTGVWSRKFNLIEENTTCAAVCARSPWLLIGCINGTLYALEKAKIESIVSTNKDKCRNLASL